jgi:hypothetical protein
MDALALFVAGVLILVVGRRVVLAAWRRGRIGTDTTAVLWAAGLPAALIVWSVARQQLSPLILVIALGVGAVQFVALRWVLTHFWSDIR